MLVLAHPLKTDVHRKSAHNIRVGDIDIGRAHLRITAIT
jgi:hypothetical protein